MRNTEFENLLNSRAEVLADPGDEFDGDERNF